MKVHCLNLKVTYNCTNNCSFCFSSYLKNQNISLESLKKAVLQGKEEGCNELVLSGGEPTLVPDTLIELISLANENGYEFFIIQTNGVGLALNKKLINFLDAIGKSKNICISFSVHGHSEALHDELSGKKGAFSALEKALSNISKTSCGIYTNTVITSKNIMHLSEIADFISPFKPKIMQFAMLHLDSPNELTVSLLDCVKAVKELGKKINLDILKTEGIPYCLLRKMEKCVGESFWPNTLDLYNNDNQYLKDFKQIDFEMRKKKSDCKNCIFDEICMGVWKEHFEEFSKLGTKAVR